MEPFNALRASQADDGANPARILPAVAREPACPIASPLEMGVRAPQRLGLDDEADARRAADDVAQVTGPGLVSGMIKRARRDFRVNVDPMDGCERAQVTASGDFDVYSVEEVWALVRAAAAGAHHTGQRAYTRTTSAGRTIHVPARPFTPVELAARRDEDLYDAAAILTAALCGLRRAGLLGLRWRAVLWEQNAILLRRGFTEVGGDRLTKSQRVLLGPRRAAGARPAQASAGHAGRPAARRPRLPGPGRHADGRLGALPALPRDPDGRRRARAALPRPAPHLRHPGDRVRRSRQRRQGVDGPPASLDDDALTSTTGRDTRPRPRSSASSPAPPPSSSNCSASRRTSASGRPSRRPQTMILDDPKKSRKTVSRGLFASFRPCRRTD